MADVGCILALIGSAQAWQKEGDELPCNEPCSCCRYENLLWLLIITMTANLLTLNSSKTEFLLIGLKKQLKLVQVIPVFSLFSCSVQQQPILLPHILLWRSSRFCPWPYTFYHVHHPTKYTNLISIAQPSPVCRRHTAFRLFLSTWSSLQHLQAPDYLTRNLFLDDC